MSDTGLAEAPDNPQPPDLPTTSLVVVDAPLSVAAWLQRVSAALPQVLDAQSQNANHDANPAQHGSLPGTLIITLPQLWRAIEQTVRDPADEPWSIAARGLPPAPDPAQGHLPDKGTWLHNVYHACGGTH